MAAFLITECEERPLESVEAPTSWRSSTTLVRIIIDTLVMIMINHPGGKVGMGMTAVKQRIMLSHANSSSTNLNSTQKYTTRLLQFMFYRICLIIVSTFLRILRRKTITWQKQPEGTPELKPSLSNGVVPPHVGLLRAQTPCCGIGHSEQKDTEPR